MDSKNRVKFLVDEDFETKTATADQNSEFAVDIQGGQTLSGPSNLLILPT